MIRGIYEHRFTSLIMGLAFVVTAIFVGIITSVTKVEAATPVTTPMNLYYGTTHTHTGAYNDHGTDTSGPLEVFNAAKANNFNFVVLTEHSGPTGPTDPAAYYAMAQTQADQTSEDGHFIGLAGYEFSENSGDDDSHSGHLTGWGTENYVDPTAPGMNFNTFMDYLVSQSTTRPVFGGFNHPPAAGHKASAVSFLNPDRRERIVMSEVQRNVGYTATDESNYYKGYVAELDRGWRVAPTCGLDGHALFAVKQAETASKKPCRTGILAPQLTKASLIEAFQNRHMFTTRDVNLQVKYSANGYWMGSEIDKPTTANLTIDVSDPDTGAVTDKIKKIEVIGNGGAILATKTFSAHTVQWMPNVTVGANTYMFIRIYNGERTAHTAVAAPIWFR